MLLMNLLQMMCLATSIALKYATLLYYTRTYIVSCVYYCLCRCIDQNRYKCKRFKIAGARRKSNELEIQKGNCKISRKCKIKYPKK